MGRVENKIAIVTGGGSGIGRAIAECLAAEGAKTVIADVDETKGVDTAKAIGKQATFRLFDAGDEAAWQELVKWTVDKFGSLDILVNNAGVTPRDKPADPEHSTLEDWRRVQRVNTEGVFLGCKYAIPAMRNSGGGSIINMSSIAALVATPFITAYGASKAAVRQLTQSVALHCAESRSGIRCNSVHPGQIRTEMLDGLFKEVSEGAGISLDEAEVAFLSKIPIGEFGDSVDIAYAVLYLASNESRHVTGEQLVVDGGMNLNP